MDPLNLKKLNSARAKREGAVLLTNLGDGRDRLIREGEEVAGALGEAVEKAMRSGKSGVFKGGDDEFFINAHVPPGRIVVIGAVHISQALAPMAAIAGFNVAIIDPRTAFATPERFAGVDLHAEWPEEVLREMPLDRYTALAAVTHDPKIDDFPLAEAIRAGCFYVGALGSRKTHGKRVERLKQAGLTDEQLATIAAPIGLDIGAASPAEIAVATLAQIIEAFRRRGLAS